MPLELENIPQTIVQTKRMLRDRLPNLDQVLAEVEAHVQEEVAEIRDRQARGDTVIPELDYATIAAGDVSPAVVDSIKRRGAVVIRQVIPRDQAETWNEQLGDYITDNGYHDTEVDPSLDQYFSNLKAGRPQIFGIYWSRPQVRCRQAEGMARTRAFLNRLWTSRRGDEVYFNPDRECIYADRIRRREPGDDTLGLSPHMDAGSVERWIDPTYRDVYRHVFSGNWRDYDPFDGAYRVEAKEIPSPAVCSAFRTHQGWIALTPQGPGDGTLQLIPIIRGIAYHLLRGLCDDVPEDELAGAAPCRALSVTKRWHAPLLAGLVSIPRVEPGDTVWWHTDIAHAVEDVNRGSGYANVIYVGAAPYCAKNAAYLQKQKAAFLSGESPPDFAAENYEVNYQGRATPDDLTELGKRQMGLVEW
jgi:hypothetical protein